MAFVFVPAIPIITAEVAAWLGLGATAAAAGAGAALYSRSKSAEKAQSKPLAQVDVRRQNEKCKQCPPDQGMLVARKWNMSDVSREYQARVTGFSPYTEWSFGGVDFDGFKSAECLLQEAKARYSQFFNHDTGRPKRFFTFTGYCKMLAQSRAQNNVIMLNAPARLNWYFLDEILFKHMTIVFQRDGLLIQTIYAP